MKENEATYLLPIWVDLKHARQKEIMKALNDALTEFFEEQADEISKVGCQIDVQWSVNQHVKLGEENK